MRQRYVARRLRPERRTVRPVTVWKLFPPVGAAAGLAIKLGGDGDTLFWLTELGVGGPELGAFSLAEIARIRLPFGLFYRARPVV